MSFGVLLRANVGSALAVVLCVSCLACQSWDRLEPSSDDTEDGAAAGELTSSVAMQRMGEIQAAPTPEESLSLIAAFIEEYPRAQLIIQLQVAAAEAQRMAYLVEVAFDKNLLEGELNLKGGADSTGS